MDFFDDIFPNEDDGEIDELSRYVQEHVMNKKSDPIAFTLGVDG